jgi:hypothetical protein
MDGCVYISTAFWPYFSLTIEVLSSWSFVLYSLQPTNQSIHLHSHIYFLLVAHYAQGRMRVRQCPSELHWRAVG